MNKPRSRAVLAAALALAIAPGGFTVADFTAKVRAMTGQAGYTTRNAAYDLRKLRGKHLADKPGRTRRYLISPGAARIISALLTLREHVSHPFYGMPTRGSAGPPATGPTSTGTTKRCGWRCGPVRRVGIACG